MITEGQILPYHAGELFRGPWLVLAPHADDETFGMGGAILKAAQAGVAVHLLIMTDGALGGDAEDLVVRRQKEAELVADMLGVTTVSFLGEPDRGLSVSEPLAEKVGRKIAETGAATVFFPSIFEPHPDHRATALIAWRSLQLLAGDGQPDAVAYEIIAQNQINTLIDISAQMPMKRQAMQQYLSQVEENNYIELCESMNKLRTFSLPASVDFAEGFYRYSRDELQESPVSLLQQRLALLVAD